MITFWHKTFVIETRTAPVYEMTKIQYNKSLYIQWSTLNDTRWKIIMYLVPVFMYIKAVEIYGWKNWQSDVPVISQAPLRYKKPEFGNALVTA